MIKRWVKGRSLLLYTCLLEEFSSMIVKNSKPSNLYSIVAERSLRWRPPPISDKHQKRPISIYNHIYKHS